MKKFIFTLTIVIGSYFSYAQTYDANFLIQNSTATTKGYLFSSPASNWGPTTSGIYFIPRDAINGTKDFSINLWNGTSGTEGWGDTPSRFFINAAGGNVGIGTTSPTTKLQVNGTISAIGAPNDINSSTPIVTGSIMGSNYSSWGISMNHIVENAGTNSYGMGLFTMDSYLTGRTEKVRISSNGNVGIGTTSPDATLTVNGTIHSKEVKVDTSIPVPDYVFETDYKLRSLNDIKAYVDKNHHLPEIPSAKEIEKNGITLGEMNMKLLKKIEELTLYLIEKDEELKQLKQQSEARISTLETALLKLASTK